MVKLKVPPNHGNPPKELRNASVQISLRLNQCEVLENVIASPIIERVDR